MSRTFRPRRIYINEDDDFEDHGAAVLLLVREEIALDWKTLCQAFGFDPTAFHSGHYALQGTIEELVEADLLKSAHECSGPYQVTDHGYAVVHALGLSLTQAANMPYSSGLAARPMFGKPRRLEKAPHLFVLMPFTARLRAVYDGPIKAACRSLRLSVERADDIFSASEVVDDIWTAIVNSGALIADCTERNTNVFYEVGIAHTLGKPVVLISQEKDDVPFNLSYVRYIEYSMSPTGLRKLESALRRTLREIGKGIWTT
jgi:hypothetical protein